MQIENLELKKCILFKKQVRFIGHLIFSKGIATDPRTIEDEQNWETPRNVHEVRSF
jgi:hypothetical protein